MHPRYLLRIEGLAILAIALAVFISLDGPWWLFVVLALAPDLSMVGYLAGNRIGSLSYNVVHTYTAPVLLAALGLAIDATLLILVAAVWTAHIGADRLVGYGLKFETGFKDSHLSSQGSPVPPLADEDPTGSG